MAYHEDSSASGQDEPWIQWFCSLKGHEMFCKVERSYIEDGFNLYGLRACVSNFSDCLDLILDRIGPDDSDDSHLTQSACTLYGLIHARYIITAHGLDAMYNKYANKEFGTCPLIQCYGQPVLPVALKDEMGADTVKIFCPKCQNVYHPPPMRYRSSHGAAALSSAAVDGAAFGTTFAHLFLMTFSNLVPDGLSPESAYVPRVFGFRVHPSSRQRSGNTSTVTFATSGMRRGGAAITASAANGGGNVEADASNHAAGGASKFSATGNDGKAKSGKRDKRKSEDSGGSSKRRPKNNGDNESNSSKKKKGDKRR
ncbi:CK_II_beta-domain-containing protein [Chaetoceros tenuissimus]|uniref:Casein kinase II subunit beta n=1 Tax=Chaetoceros tenuissimus TaxID=426638 RepID=A0AAD3H690_9STRA|nr:CK_II_beta-domain-containing protein [Chaetoceros tenuissimus]